MPGLPRTTLPKLTDRLALSNTDMRVSPFCLGMVTEEDTVCAAFDAGINFFFLTGDLHWPYYERSRRGLEKLFARGSNIRDQVVVAVASYVTQPDFCGVVLHEVVAAVAGLEFVDVAIAGGAYSWEFLRRLRVYLDIRNQNLEGVKAIGATFHDRRAALVAVNDSLVDIAFSRYNPSHPGAKTDLFPHLTQSPSTLFYNFNSTLGAVSPDRYAALGLNDDYWQPSVTDYYRFALTKPELDGVLCSPKSPQEVDALVRALEQGPLDEDEEEYLVDLAKLNEGRAELIAEETNMTELM
jgi:hypothetical protein